MEPPPRDTPRSAGRPWIKWVALGCGAFVLLGLLAAGGLALLVMGGMKRSEAFQHAMEAARASPEVEAALGEPVTSGWWLTGSFEVSGPTGEASMAIPVRGPEGRGTLYVEATKAAGRWSYTTLTLV